MVHRNVLRFILGLTVHFVPSCQHIVQHNQLLFPPVVLKMTFSVAILHLWMIVTNLCFHQHVKHALIISTLVSTTTQQSLIVQWNFVHSHQISLFVAIFLLALHVNILFPSSHFSVIIAPFLLIHVKTISVPMIAC